MVEIGGEWREGRKESERRNLETVGGFWRTNKAVPLSSKPAMIGGVPLPFFKSK